MTPFSCGMTNFAAKMLINCNDTFRNICAMGIMLNNKNNNRKACGGGNSNDRGGKVRREEEEELLPLDCFPATIRTRQD